MILRTAALSLALFPLLGLGNPIPVPQIDCRSGQDSCGSICCSETQYCPDASAGRCMPRLDINGVAITSLWVETISTQYVVTRTKVWDDAVGTAQATYNPSSYNPSSYAGATGTYNPPLKPTETDDEGVKITGGIIYPFPTGTGNGTTDFGGVIGGNTSSGGGLTGGQIGGIVAGVLVTFFLIALICFCCCLRKGFQGLGGWMSSGWKDSGSSHHSGGGGGHSGLKAGLGLAAAGALLGKMFGGKKESTAYTSTSYDASTEHSGGGGMKKKGMLAASLGALAGGWWAKRKYDNHKTTTESSGYYTHSSSYDSRSSSDVSSSDGSSSSSSSSSSSGPRR